MAHSLKLVQFHGGCHGCTQQRVQPQGYDFCIKCQYFAPNWNLPDLNNRPLDEAEKLKLKIIAKHTRGQTFARKVIQLFGKGE